MVDKVFTRRGEARVERAAERLSGLGFDARIEELTRILDEDGYLAQCRREADGSWLVVDTAYTPRVTAGLLTGWHEPMASHLAMVEAFAGSRLLEESYRAALDAGYLWHEFGDSHLILP